MSESRSSLGELIGHTGANLKIVAARFNINVVTADELRECSGLLKVLADALTLYADKLEPARPAGARHALREPPDDPHRS
ncbi:hypothetical protein [Amycolatopsis sp. cmx-8-4]|uniref:hypothetical protein n=1 Tax=Amycolatopsis sp. cmx-8-4 TaxID=2790947 RepID=UPI00397C0A17